MSGYSNTLSTAQAVGSPNTGTSILSLLPTSALFTLPGGALSIGSKIRIEASGQMNTVVTSPGTLIFTMKFGAVAVFTSQAIALNIVAQTNATWTLALNSTVRAVGSSTAANLITTGSWVSRASLNAPAVATTNGVGAVLLPDTAPSVGTGFDSTISNLIDLQATTSVAASIQLLEYELTVTNWTP